jgi:glucose/arabinose dehydrogenase
MKPFRRPRAALLLLCLLTASLGASRARAALLAEALVASGLDTPMFALAPWGDPRLFILERPGRIRILKDGNVLATPFLDIASGVGTAGEGGLLGLAFPPDFQASGAFYVYYTDGAGDSVVSRFFVSAANPDLAHPAETPILSLEQPFSNHNGGSIAFGGDGFLYFSPGDGGSANDPGERAQDPSTLLGKMLRIDVGQPLAPGSTPVPGTGYGIPAGNPWEAAGDGVRDEIWAFGLRNPYRFSFDRNTGDLWIADVGQDALEEIDFEPGGDPGGRNWGWDVMEGDRCNAVDPAPAPPCNHASLSLPIHQYAHAGGGCSGSITGGFLYRGKAIPALNGLYVYGDYCNGRIWSFDPVAMLAEERSAELGAAGGAPFQLLGFGQDGDGELYVVHAGGSIYRIIPRTECSDGIDNDDDLATDHPDDPGCAERSSKSESPACNDLEDNDNDGLVDLADPNCGDDPAHIRESSSCGGGGAAALILVPLTLATRRRLR